LQHLEELRWHLVRSAIAITIGGVVAFLNKSLLFDGIIFYPRSPDFPTYKMICDLSTRFLGEGMMCMDEAPFVLMNMKMAGQFSTHIWVSLIAGLILAFPYVVYEFWKFLKPGLRASEVKASRWTGASVSILFALGVLFGYYLIVPLSVQFLGTYTISAEVSNLIDLTSFISTVTTVTLACGLLFELPVMVYFLASLGIITPEDMKKYRRHAIVVILILAAIITPPDVSSQVLVTLPVMLLYELSIKVARWSYKKEGSKKEPNEA
ncbi:MAG: twin-arginine translocase subunit TatC, partial [Bacteroidota bacterium]|nr:twin-arginine translocase subunit TatC [Bacteroidota bacterium]